MRSQHLDIISRSGIRARLGYLYALAILISGSLLAIAMAVQFEQYLHERDHQRFLDHVGSVTDDFQQRVALYKQGLASIRSAFYASQHVSLDEFRTMIVTQDLKLTFPGTLGIGYITRTPREQQAESQLEQALRQAGHDNFLIHDVPGHTNTTPERYVIQYIEPAADNPTAAGLDIASEPLRREAAVIAMETALPTITGVITLVQASNERAGFLLLLPIYENRQDPGTVDARHEQCIGWVYMPLIGSSMFAGLTDQVGRQIDLAVYDQPNDSSRVLIFNDEDDATGTEHNAAPQQVDNPLFHKRNQIHIGARAWTLAMSSTNHFNTQSRWGVIFLLVGGIGISALLATLVHNQGVSLRRAHTLALTMTQELRELAMVAEGTTNAVIIADPQRRITWVNRGFTTITGYTLDEARGRNPGSFLQCEQTDQETAERMRDALRREQSFRGEILNRGKNGNLYWLELDIQPIRENGQVTGFMAIESDITERKQKEQEIHLARDSAEKALQRLNTYRNALDRHSIVAMTDASGTITEVNDLFCEISGYTREELVGQNHKILNSGHHSKSFWINMWRDIASGRQWHGEVYNRAKNGSHYWVDTTISPMRDADGKIDGFCAVRTDITHMKQVQDEIEKARQAAEVANHSKSEFLANMSHEIRTPLTAILGYADLLEEPARTENDLERQQQTIVTIRRAGAHLLAVINDILDLSKIEAGKLNLEQIDTHLPRILLDIESLMRSRAEGKGVRLTTRLNTPIPNTIHTDPTRLRQILMNLVGNAAKFTEAGAIEVHVAYNRNNDRPTLRIEIQDTGPGMTPDEASLLFKPFSQADTSVSRRHGGTGLGLTISRRLASLMGGKIWLDWTEPGQGSRFIIELPAQPSADAATVDSLQFRRHTESDQQNNEHKPIQLTGRILLAEDGIDNQRLISFHLSKAGAEVVVVDNGRIALDAFQQAIDEQQPFDLIVSDMQMPEMDGYALARRIRETGSTIPIIALTAHAMAEDRQKCLEAGCDDYASKPIDRTALLTTCQYHLTNPPTSQNAAA
ncbi:MAG: PAS domain S-box protein [Phycisphaeraceae bacterium]